MDTEREYGGYTAREIEGQWLKLPGGIIAWDLVKHVNQLLADSQAMQEQLQAQQGRLEAAEQRAVLLQARTDFLAREQYCEHAARCARMNQPAPTYEHFCQLMWQAIDVRIEKGGEHVRLQKQETAGGVAAGAGRLDG